MQAKIGALVDGFKKSIGFKASLAYWSNASEGFKIFWKEKIMNERLKDLRGKEIEHLDPIVRILENRC
jgi:hypothetical protein